MANKYIKDLTANTAPAETDAVEIDDGTNSEYVTIRNLVKSVTGYALISSTASSAPADSTTYYMGHPIGLTIQMSSVAGSQKIYVPKAGTITRVDMRGRIVTTLGTSETASLYLRLNNTTDTTLSTTLNFTADPITQNFTGLSIVVAVGDYFEYKLVTPAWVTNPAGVFLSFQAWVE